MPENTIPVISVQDLRKNYGEKEVLKGISFEIYPGQIVGYIGSNGAGKSTTIKILLGLIEEYYGTIKIFGTDIRTDIYNYKRKIGYVPETADIYDCLTPREFLNFLGEIYGMDSSEIDNKAKQLLELFSIKEVYDKRISSFSKGMKQKVLIIASLLHNPDILFFDEPLSGLDANSVLVFKEIMSILANEGKTILYSSHIMDVVERISDKIILLNNGKIAANASFAELQEKSKEGSLEEIFNQLTGFDKFKEIANEFVNVLKGA